MSRTNGQQIRSMDRLSKLPFELLQYIFDLATYNPLRELRIKDTSKLEPFETLFKNAQEKQMDKALLVKHALSLVSWRFRLSVAKFLYEDIRVRHGSDALARCLERRNPDHPNGLGHLAKRICLYPAEEAICRAFGGSVNKNSSRILRCCPNIQNLARHRLKPSLAQISAPVSQARPKDFDTSSVLEVHPVGDFTFPLLKCVDWCNEASRFEDYPGASLPIPRFVWRAPSLHILSLDGNTYPQHPRTLHMISTSEICLPNVHTIRSSSFENFGNVFRRPSRISIPSFRHFILSSPAAIFSLIDGCLEPYRSQITVFEFELHIDFLYIDSISILTRCCPNVQELRFPLFTTVVPEQTTDADCYMSSVKHVQLHAAPVPIAEAQEGDLEDDIAKNPWGHVEAHFHSLCGEESKFSGLTHITLYGLEWDTFMADENFKYLEKLARDRGVILARGY